MEVEMLLRIAAVVVAGGFLVQVINWSDIWTNIKLRFKRKDKEVVEEEVDFLEIVSLWHTLKDKCTLYGLEEAVEKLDEVFPLLNSEEKNV